MAWATATRARLASVVGDVGWFTLLVETLVGGLDSIGYVRLVALCAPKLDLLDPTRAEKVKQRVAVPNLLPWRPTRALVAHRPTRR